MPATENETDTPDLESLEPKPRKKISRAAKNNANVIVESGEELEDSDDNFKPQKKKQNLVFTAKDIQAMKSKSMHLMQRVCSICICCHSSLN